jgi:Heavy metal associated domain 2
VPRPPPRLASPAALSRGVAPAQILHRIPGRLRLRLPDPADPREVVTALEGQGGFLSWRWNHRTRSLLLLYDTQATSSEAVLEIVADRLDGLDIEQAPPSAPAAAKPSALAVAVSQGLAELDSRVTNATRGLLDLRFLFPLALFAWAARELGRGAVAPLAWSSALWYAHGLFRDYNLATPPTDGDH